MLILGDNVSSLVKHQKARDDLPAAKVVVVVRLLLQRRLLLAMPSLSILPPLKFPPFRREERLGRAGC